MSCNIPRTPTASLQWPPTRHTHRNPSTTGTPSLETPSRVLASLNLNTPRILAPPNLHSDSSPAPKPASSLGARRTYRNGYEVKPQAPSYRPYALNNQGYRRQHAFVVEDVPHIKSSEPLAQSQWDDLARTHKIIKAGWTVKPFQAECANHVLGRATDVCLIAPTGAGKSTLWVLPLGVQRQGISLVVTPYTSLGAEGELRMREMGFSSVFVHAGQNTETILISIARGHYRVIFVCAEELESPTFARVVHCEAFQNMLSAIYIDEAHLVRESESWRFPYTRLHMLRKIVGEHVPLVCLSATLPQEYRDALVLHAGLRKDYQLINLGNFRPELATAVVPMTHPATSFLDLSFVIPINSTALPDRTIVYTDDVERLTAMFWWFINRLAAANLPVTAVDILHAGLSDTHQEMCIRDFREGRTRILLGTAKIGCGMNFPGVKRVVQYMVRGLTLSGYRQREGRGGRAEDSHENTTAVGYLLVEESMQAGKGPSIDNPGYEDEGLLALIHAEAPTCLDGVYDQYLGNPPRVLPTASTRRICCSNCIPTLIPSQDLLFIMYEPPAENTRTNTDIRDLILSHLVKWRLDAWKDTWRAKWPDHGPKSLIPTSDLETLSIHARSVKTVDDLRVHTHIVYWSDLAPALLAAVQSALAAADSEVRSLQLPIPSHPGPTPLENSHGLTSTTQGQPSTARQTAVSTTKRRTASEPDKSSAHVVGGGKRRRKGG